MPAAWLPKGCDYHACASFASSCRILFESRRAPSDRYRHRQKWQLITPHRHSKSGGKQAMASATSANLSRRERDSSSHAARLLLVCWATGFSLLSFRIRTLGDASVTRYLVLVLYMTRTIYICIHIHIYILFKARVIYLKKHQRQATFSVIFVGLFKARLIYLKKHQRQATFNVIFVGACLELRVFLCIPLANPRPSWWYGVGSPDQWWPETGLMLRSFNQVAKF